MRSKKDAKVKAVLLKRERAIKLAQKRACMIMETSREFEEASLRGEEHPIVIPKKEWESGR